MPRGPKGEKRPANVFDAAILVGRIAVGEVEDAKGTMPNRAKGGKIGGKRRTARLSPEKRKEIAKKAAESRWRDKS